MTKELYEFLVAWLLWAETNGTPFRSHDYTFSPRYGLCWNVPDRAMVALTAMIEREFPSNTSFPFGDFIVYAEDRNTERQHKNPLRLAWVRAKIKEYEDAN